MKGKTIRAKIALLISGLILLILTGFGLFLYASLSTQLQRTLDEVLRSNADRLLAMVENQDGRLYIDQGDAQTVIPRGSEADVIRLVALTGEILDDRSEEQIPVDPQTLSGQGGFYTIRYQGSASASQKDKLNSEGAVEVGNMAQTDSLRLLSVPVLAGGNRSAYLQVGRNLEPLQNTLGQFSTLLLISGPVLVLLAALAGYWLAGRALTPIETIRLRAASIGAQDLSRRLDFDLPDDEVGRLARTFNAMLSRLDESFRRQRRFTADASHELRTPLAIIRGEVDVTLEQPRTPAQYEAALRSIGAEAERMTRLASDLLLLARSDAAELPLQRDVLDLADLLSVLVDEMRPQAEAAAVQLRTDLPQPLPVWADSDRLLQLFINLLENTLFYAAGSTVLVRGRLRPDVVEVTVADTGPGIAPEHLPNLFERFYRVDKARSRAGGGSGLGLAIAQEIAHAHGGEIGVESEVGAGTIFILRLPKAR